MDIDFPFHVDGRGRTAAAGEDEHLRDLIEQILFTAPGERVNRPEFGSGLLQMVFTPNSNQLATTTQFLVQSALQRWLGDRIQVDRADVEADGSILRVTVQYIDRRTEQPGSAAFERGVAS